MQLWHGIGNSIIRPTQLYLALCCTFLGSKTGASKSPTSSSSPTTSVVVSPTAAICPFATVNYITHSLPQQCLRTSWGEQSTAQGPSQGPSGGFETHSIDGVSETAPTKPPASAQQESGPTSVTPSHSSEATPEVVPSASSKLPDDDDTDTDSPLDNSKFLSFEDWKRVALARADHSAEKIERAGGNEPRKRPGGLNNALDSLGEDAEIELDFQGFVPENAEPTAWGRRIVDNAGHSAEDGDAKSSHDDPLPPQRRSKDAGKTCKERFNYASFDCAANILKHNPECSGASSVLVENKDSYMLNECAAENKYFIVELCNDILVDTIVLANFEFFSSIFRTFRVSVSDRYPVKLDKWHVLGTFEARNTREVQAFLIENPLIWARYLRIEFLTRYGNEYYCPISLLRVHGTTPYEELKREGDSLRGEDEPEHEPEHEPSESVAEETGARTNKTTSGNSSEEYLASARDDAQNQTSSDAVPGMPPSGSFCIPEDPLSELLSVFQDFNVSVSSCDPQEAPSPVETVQSPAQSVTDSFSSQTNQDTSSTFSPTTEDSPTSSAHKTSTTADSASVSNSSSPMSSKSTNYTSSEGGKVSSSNTQPHPPNPTTQESFLKSIHKRLQMLESNSTLSLLYIEEQSRILRDAFSKVEKRQLNKTSSFLENLNVTVLSELRDFRQQYDQIWQSTVIELESQRESYRREVVAITTRLSVLADEVVFQKRMSIVQSVLILLCLGLVLFTKGAATPLELPMMQNVLTRSQSGLLRVGGTSTFASPTGSPPSTRPSSSYMEKRGLGFFRRHRRGISDDSRDDAFSPTIHYSPPTPTSETGPSGEDEHEQEDEHESRSHTSSPDPPVEPAPRPRSSPPTLENSSTVHSSDASSWSETESPQINTPSDKLASDDPNLEKKELQNSRLKVVTLPNG